MNAFWSYFWPAFGAGLLFGAILGTLWLRRKRPLFLAAGAALTLAGAALWHGPAGGADRFAADVEAKARVALVNYEMKDVQVHLHHGPLTRRLILSGEADDFQRSELVRILSTIPGVSGASWSGKPVGLPLLVQGLAVSALGFLLGLLLAYGVELRRRYNAQWNW